MSLEPMGPVIVGADGSLASLAAVDLAADEAAGRVTPLVVVHADDATTEGTHGPAGMQAAHDVLVVAVAKARSEHPCLSVSGALVLGEPAEVLLSQSRDACLLVVGQRGHYGVRGLPIGSVTSQVISQAEIPVIVHRPLDTSISVAQPRPVLIGIDDIAGSDSVVEFGFAEASLRGAPLRAMHVWSESDALSAALNPDERDLTTPSGRPIGCSARRWRDGRRSTPTCAFTARFGTAWTSPSRWRRRLGRLNWRSSALPGNPDQFGLRSPTHWFTAPAAQSP